QPGTLPERPALGKLRPVPRILPRRQRRRTRRKPSDRMDRPGRQAAATEWAEGGTPPEGREGCRGDGGFIVRSSAASMPRFKLLIEYAGTRYSGWQIQKNARTVQGEIDRAVAVVTGRREFELYGSGRTDAGVHAVAQVAHLEVYTTLAPELLRRKINYELPADIHIRSIDKAPHRFHARHDARSRSYL